MINIMMRSNAFVSVSPRVVTGWSVRAPCLLYKIYIYIKKKG